MNDDALKHGAFGWTELMTTDVNGARRFYTSLFDWHTEPAPMDGMEYNIIKIDGDGVGGIMSMPPDSEGMPPFWSVYVTVNDVDAVASKVERLGGALLRPPEDIPGVGRFCVIQDPQGATICAMTYEK